MPCWRQGPRSRLSAHTNSPIGGSASMAPSYFRPIWREDIMRDGSAEASAAPTVAAPAR